MKKSVKSRKDKPAGKKVDVGVKRARAGGGGSQNTGVGGEHGQNIGAGDSAPEGREVHKAGKGGR